MSNHQDNEFESLLDSTFSGSRMLEPGQQVETEIVAISGGCIFLQLDGKSEGQLDAVEMTDKNGNLTVKEGDTIKAFFLSSQNGVMQFTTRLSGDKAENSLLESAFENGIPIEGTVEKEIKGGYEVKIGETRAFCPYSQMGLKREETPGDTVGKHLTFKITEYGENGRNILVSNRAILQEKQQIKIEALKKSLQEDMKVQGTIMSIQDYGAFVDIGGVQALLPISEISRERVEDIRKILSPGQVIEVAILKLDWKNERISVSMKKLLPDPWDTADARYPKGSKHKGSIARITNFGAFVTLETGLDGLIHISDLKGEERLDHPREAVKTGQSIEVEIMNIDTRNRRISLKPVDDSRGNEDYSQYMEPESDTYNPFSVLLNNKKEKK